MNTKFTIRKIKIIYGHANPREYKIMNGSIIILMTGFMKMAFPLFLIKRRILLVRITMTQS